MKRRKSVKTLIQNPFPFPFNSPPRRLKLASLFFPSSQFPFPVRHLLCRLLYTEGQQILKLWRHLTDHCSQYVFLLIRITQNFRKVHACYTCLCYSGIVRGRLSSTFMVDTSCIETHQEYFGKLIRDIKTENAATNIHLKVSKALRYVKHAYTFCNDSSVGLINAI